jgi:uncharacterized protein (TIGR04255 family)
MTGVNVNPGSFAPAAAHIFRSKKQRWTLTLRSSAITLETQDYDSFAEFEQRIAFVIEAAVATIDSDFFTRVGLRYINVLPFNSNEIDLWVNPSLVTPLRAGVYGDVDEMWQQVRGHTTAGGFFFQHGLNPDMRRDRREYILDYDFYCEDVGVRDTMTILNSLKDLEFAMFIWSLGERAREHLGPSVSP